MDYSKERVSREAIRGESFVEELGFCGQFLQLYSVGDKKRLNKELRAYFSVKNELNKGGGVPLEKKIK